MGDKKGKKRHNKGIYERAEGYYMEITEGKL